MTDTTIDWNLFTAELALLRQERAHFDAPQPPAQASRAANYDGLRTRVGSVLTAAMHAYDAREPRAGDRMSRWVLLETLGQLIAQSGRGITDAELKAAYREFLRVTDQRAVDPAAAAAAWDAAIAQMRPEPSGNGKTLLDSPDALVFWPMIVPAWVAADAAGLSDEADGGASPAEPTA